MDNINGTISGGEFLHEGMMLLQTISNLPFFRKHVRSRVFIVRNESLSEGSEWEMARHCATGQKRKQLNRFPVS